MMAIKATSNDPCKTSVKLIIINDRNNSQYSCITVAVRFEAIVLSPCGKPYRLSMMIDS